MEVGFIGLGHLGTAMARRLISQGVDLAVWNRTIEKAQGLGAEVAKSPAALVSEAPIIFMNLFDSNAVRDVLAGPEGILRGECKDKLIIDTTTNGFEDAAEFHRLVGSKGGHYLESTVLGSVIPASQGALTILVSGEKDSYDKALPYLQKLGQSIFYLGEPMLATKMKLVNNLILGSFMATIAEAVTVGEAVGLDRSQVIDILAAGAGNSGVLNAKKEKLKNEDFSTHFSSALIYKDLKYLQDLSYLLRKPLFTAAAIKELYGMTFQRDMDKQDFSAIYKIFKEY